MLKQKLTPTLERRFVRTLDFLQESMPPPARILDLGGPNMLAERMRATGYEVRNTEGDLDEPPTIVRQSDLDAVTAFEILEHLVAPFNVLRAIEAPKLFATVPLRLWFAPAYRNPNDPLDRHFHEYEDWQFDWLLERAGWTIVRRAKWTSTFFGIGIRPLLRIFTPRLYAVEAIRKSDG